MKYVMIIAGLMGAYAIAHYAYISTQQIEIDKHKIVHLKPGEKDYQFTLDQLSNHYKDSEKVDFFADMAKDLLVDERQIFMQVLTDSFKHEVSKNISLFVLKIPKMKLRNEEIIFFAKETCNTKRSKEDFEKIEQSFKSINFDYQKICSR